MCGSGKTYPRHRSYHLSLLNLHAGDFKSSSLPQYFSSTIPKCRKIRKVNNRKFLPVITLTIEETQQALDIGRRRHKSSESHGYLQSDGSKASNGLKNHQRGAAAERSLPQSISEYRGVLRSMVISPYQILQTRSRYAAETMSVHTLG
jgi:hypothetical protein